MYKINNKFNLKKIIIRGINLSKKQNIKLQKQTMVFLRAPKHFNIGKHKILSFKNKKIIQYNINIFFYYKMFYSSIFYFAFINYYRQYNLNLLINSINVEVKLKIK